MYEWRDKEDNDTRSHPSVFQHDLSPEEVQLEMNKSEAYYIKKVLFFCKGELSFYYLAVFDFKIKIVTD